MISRWIRTSALIALVVSLLLAAVGTVHANGQPRRVVLTYQPEVSNWGPKGATGVAELVMVEGEVRLTAIGLPKLTDETYAVWLMNSKSQQALELGQFNADNQGEARMEKVLPEAIPDGKWDLLLLTVEKAGAARSAPGSRRAIAGFIGEHGQSATTPQQLPKTGAGEQPAGGESASSADTIRGPGAGGALQWVLVALAAVAGAVGATLWQRNIKRRAPTAAERREGEQ